MAGFLGSNVQCSATPWGSPLFSCFGVDLCVASVVCDFGAVVSGWVLVQQVLRQLRWEFVAFKDFGKRSGVSRVLDLVSSPLF